MASTEPTNLNRMFRWKGILLIAKDLAAAWKLILAMVEESDEEDVQTWERETRYFTGDPLYDSVDPYEYLHAINPEEILEILEYDMPSGLIEISDKFAMDSPGVIIHQHARFWAEFLPLGWTFVPPEG